jgi:hypothetical protein
MALKRVKTPLTLRKKKAHVNFLWSIRLQCKLENFLEISAISHGSNGSTHSTAHWKLFESEISAISPGLKDGAREYVT